jgi:hypothetical protein
MVEGLVAGGFALLVGQDAESLLTGDFPLEGVDLTPVAPDRYG